VLLFIFSILLCTVLGVCAAIVIIVIFIQLDHIIRRHDQPLVFADISFLVSDSATVKLVSGMISGFRREMAVNCALLGCYAACSGNFLLS
jgi:hypothetical protein